MKKALYVLAVLALPFLSACKNGVNIFSIEDDISLGKELKQEIFQNPAEFRILDRKNHKEAYAYLGNILDQLLKSKELTYKKEFAWEIHIVDDDEVKNAFCAPGGYIFVYTGLIKYLDSEDQLAGVLGHEMAHADKRHTTQQLTKAYGIQMLFSLILGENQGQISDIAQGLMGLEFSRGDEREADEYSVRYLCGTKYASDGASDFFEKLVKNEEAGGAPTFLSTHPDPGNRVQDIRSLSKELKCKGKSEFNQEYENFKRLF